MNHLLLLSPTSRWDTNMTFNKGQNGQTRRRQFLVLSRSLSSFNAAVVFQRKGSMQDSLRWRRSEVFSSPLLWDNYIGEFLKLNPADVQYLLPIFTWLIWGIEATWRQTSPRKQGATDFPETVFSAARTSRSQSGVTETQQDERGMKWSVPADRRWLSFGL